MLRLQTDGKTQFVDTCMAFPVAINKIVYKIWRLS